MIQLYLGIQCFKNIFRFYFSFNITNIIFASTIPGVASVISIWVSFAVVSRMGHFLALDCVINFCRAGLKARLRYIHSQFQSLVEQYSIKTSLELAQGLQEYHNCLNLLTLYQFYLQIFINWSILIHMKVIIPNKAYIQMIYLISKLIKQKMKHLFFFILIAAANCSIVSTKLPQKLHRVIDESKLDTEHSKCNQFIRLNVPQVKGLPLISYKDQIVSGMKYCFTYGQTSKSLSLCVWSQPWINHFLQLVKPDGKTVTSGGLPPSAASNPK